MATRHLEPLELGIAGVDLKAIAGTQYASGVLDVRRDFAFAAIVSVVNVGGGAAGAAKLTVQVLAKDKTTVLYSVDILTAIGTLTVGTTKNVVTFGYGLTATVDGLASLAPAAEVLKTMKFIRIILEVVTASDGTSSAGSVDLFAERI